MTNVAFIVISNKDAVRLGVVSADGESLIHTRTVDELRAVMYGERLQRYQAEELAIECGGGWIVDTDGDTTWQDGR